MMERKLFYRVENPDTVDGLWYNKDGTYTGRIHTEEFSQLRLCELPMPYDEEILGWVSVTDSLETLKVWFNDEDMAILRPKGFKVTEYESDEYRSVDGHWVMKQNSAKFLRAF